MGILQSFRTRWQLFRLDYQVRTLLESLEYHKKLAHLALGIAERDEHALGQIQRELESVRTALGAAL